MHNTSILKQTQFIILGIIIILFFTLCPTQKIETPKEPENFDKIIFDWSRTFAQVMQIAHEQHFKISNPEDGMIKAIDAFVNHLDPHSSFLDPKTYKSILQDTSGEFFGIGVVIDNSRKPKDKSLTIIDTIPDGPADKVGVKGLDKIIEIDGEALEGMSTEQASSKLKGNRNTKVHIKIIRENKNDLLQFDITRDVVKEKHTLSFHIKNHDIYYLSLRTFSEIAIKQVETLLNQAQKKNYRGLILDLRNNSGGLLNAAVDIAGLFVEKDNTIVTIKNKHGKPIETWKTTRNPIPHNNIPIFILINNYTASAAEILAGCLKIYAGSTKKNNKNPLVFLVGTKTFGKGSVQTVMPIGNNCALKITTGLYYLPNDTTIQGIGIEPDFLVEQTLPLTEQMQWFTQYYGREETINNHIQITKKEEPEKIKKEKIDSKSRWQEQAKKMLQTDNQLVETITLINILHTAKKHMPEKIKYHSQVITYLKQSHVCNDKLEIEEINV